MMHSASFISILKILKIGVMRNFSKLILRCFQWIGCILSSAEWHIRESSRRRFEITHSRGLPPVCKKDFFDIGNQCFANLQKSKNDAINDGRAENRDRAGLANAAGASFPATRTIEYGPWPLDRCGGAAAQ